MGLRTVLKTAGHWLKGSIVKVDSEIQFDSTTNPEIDSTGGGFVWKTLNNVLSSWKLRDDTVGEDIIALNTRTAVKTLTLHPNYSAIGFGWTRVTETTATRNASANEFILINAATCVITLPPPSDNTVIALKVIAVPTDIQIKTSGVGIDIDGTDYSTTGLLLTTQWEQISLISDGTHWYIY
jgi:hypothetical protein